VVRCLLPYNGLPSREEADVVLYFFRVKMRLGDDAGSVFIGALRRG